LFIIKPEEQDVIFFLIDASLSMESDSLVCPDQLSYYEWAKYKMFGKHVTRMNIVKEVLKTKIASFPEKQKFFIWESRGKNTFDNLEGSKSKGEAKKFIDKIEANYVFYYKDAFTALLPRIEKLGDNANTVVSLLTDGGITDENPSESQILKTILGKGVKKWELKLYNQPECAKDINEEEKKIMKALKKTVGIKEDN